MWLWVCGRGVVASSPFFDGCGFLWLFWGVWVLFVNSIVCLFLCLFFVFEFVVFVGIGWLRLVWLVFFWICFCSESLILAQDERWRRA